MKNKKGNKILAAGGDHLLDNTKIISLVRKHKKKRKSTLKLRKPLVNRNFNSWEKPHKDRLKSATNLNINREVKKSIIEGDANAIKNLKFSKRPKSRDFNSTHNRILIRNLHSRQSSDSRFSDTKM